MTNIFVRLLIGLHFAFSSASVIEYVYKQTPL